MPVGAPHLGAPKALRSVLTGDKMSLDAFLSNEEALLLGRSFSSGPWMFPVGNLPGGMPATVYVKKQGVLEIRLGRVDVSSLIERRRRISISNRYRLTFIMGNTEVTTPFRELEDGKYVSFEDDVVYLATTATPGSLQLRVALEEPGLRAAKHSYRERRGWCRCLKRVVLCVTCCWICGLIWQIIKQVLLLVLRFFIMSADLFMRAADGGSILAFSTKESLSQRQLRSSISLEVKLIHRDDYARKFCCLTYWIPSNPRRANLRLTMQWKPSVDKAEDLERGTAPSLCIPGDACPSVNGSLAVSADMVLRNEGLADSTLAMTRERYTRDSLAPHTRDPPPVHRIHAIYGINLPTEVGVLLDRPSQCVSTTKNETSRHRVDIQAKLAVLRSSGYKTRQGIIYEEKYGLQATGDGTVPYFSLSHCKSWSDCRHVTTVQLHGAEHREILADGRFHKAVIEYCVSEE